MKTIPSVYEPVFKARFYFIHGPESVLLRLCKDLGHEIEPHGGAGRCVVISKSKRGLQAILYVNGDMPLHSGEAVGALAHEAVHAALGVFEAIGVDTAPITRASGSDEFLAYYTEWIVSAFVDEIETAKGKRKK